MHAFKVGDKGRTRGGESYEVIAVEPRAKYYTMAVFFPDREVMLMRSAAGRVNAADRHHQGDLLPPTVTKYVNLVATHFRGIPVTVTSKPFDSADQARAHACPQIKVTYVAIAVPVEMPA